MDKGLAGFCIGGIIIVSPTLLKYTRRSFASLAQLWLERGDRPPQLESFGVSVMWATGSAVPFYFGKADKIIMTMQNKTTKLIWVLIPAIIFYGLYFTIGGDLWGTLGLLFAMVAVGFLLVRGVTEIVRFKKQEGLKKEKVVRILKPFGLALLIVIILAGVFTISTPSLRNKIGLGEPLYKQLANYLTGGEEFANATKALDEMIKEKQLTAYSTKDDKMILKFSDDYSPDAKFLSRMLYLGLAVDMAKGGTSVLDIYRGDELYAHFEKGNATAELQKLGALDKFGSPTEAVGGLSDETKKQIENDLKQSFKESLNEIESNE